MTTKVDGKRILDKLREDKGDRTKVSLYLSKTLYADFKRSCKDIPASQVMEELMRTFIESIHK